VAGESWFSWMRDIFNGATGVGLESVEMLGDVVDSTGRNLAQDEVAARGGPLGSFGCLAITFVLALTTIAGLIFLWSGSDAPQQPPGPGAEGTDFGNALRDRITNLGGDGEPPPLPATPSTPAPSSTQGIEPPAEGSWSFTNEEGTLTCDGEPGSLAEAPPAVAEIAVLNDGAELRVTSQDNGFAGVLVLVDNTPGHLTYEGTVAPESAVAGIAFEFELIFDSVTHALTTMGGTMPLGAQTCVFHREGEATLSGG